MALTLSEIAELVNGELTGRSSASIDGVATLSSASSSQLAFIHQKKYLSQLKETGAGVVLLTPEFLSSCPVDAIVCDNPYLAYAQVATTLFPRFPVATVVHPTAVIGRDCSMGDNVCLGAHVVVGNRVSIGDDVQIGPGCVIGDDVQIGRGSVLFPNVTVYQACVLGEETALHSGVVIGADGFGYAPGKAGWTRIPQLGRVVLGNGVEIGANSTIDRGALDDTTIGDGVIIDNLVQVGHNVQIGEHTAIAACTAIAGSTRIGKHCTIAGAVGIVGHIQIADRVHITGMTLVSHSITEPGAYSSGVPMETNANWHRNAVRFKQLDQMAKRLRSIEKSMNKN